MKRTITTCQLVLFMSILFTSCRKMDTGSLEQTRPRSVLSGPAIVSAHRANDLIKVDEVANAGINSLEVDIFVGQKNGQPTCLIGHEAATATGQTLEEYFEHLNDKMPNFDYVWLDCKDLNSAANEQVFMTTLNNLDNLYSIKSRVLVESQYISYLVSFKQQGWQVSYYCNWEDVYGEPPATQQTVMGQMYSQLTTYGIDGISYDAAVDSPMKDYFSTKTVGGQPVKMYAWALGRYYGEADLETKLAQYSHLSVLLISFYSQQATLVDGANYKLVSALTNEPSSVLDVNSSTPVNGTKISLWENNYPTSDNQVYKLRNLGGGYYALKSLTDTTKVMNVKGGSSANSTQVEVYSFSNSNAQRWQINYVGSGYYNLTPACAPGKNLDVNGGATANGTKIQIYSAHTGNSQKFKLVRQEDTPGAPPTGSVTDLTVAVPMGGNSYITNGATGATIYDDANFGLRNWTNLAAVTSTYFKVANTGTLYLGIKGYVTTGTSVVRLTVNGQSFDVTMTGGAPAKTYYAGSVSITSPGYVKVDLVGVSKTSTYIGNMTDIMIGGPAAATGLIYASDSNNFYWSRRGPSIHLNHTLTSGNTYEWMYNEVTVPSGQDPIGSYYMSNGFGQGYFGFQVNSATKRQVLFSVWDPSSGETTLESKGDDVEDGTFSGEGTGGKSYLLFNWVVGNTYKFLTRIRPDGAGSTLYSSWFYAPEVGAWKYIATFKRPNTTTYVSGQHSFLENFSNSNGYLGRKAFFTNFWARTTGGTWIESVSTKLTVDNAGSSNQRKDYKAGVENGKFYMQNGGFFNDFVQQNTTFTRPATGTAPTVNLNTLPMN